MKDNQQSTNEEIREAFLETTSGFYITKCVENGTMDKKFLENQLEEFSSGYKAALQKSQDAIEENTNALEWGYRERFNLKSQIKELKQQLHENKIENGQLIVLAANQEQQIESMKCCGNCGKYEDCLDNENAFYRNVCGKWKQKE